MRIRAMTQPTHEAITASLGGAPSPLPWAEFGTALQTGGRGWADAPGAGDRFRQIRRSAGMPVDHQPCDHACIRAMNDAFHEGPAPPHEALAHWAASVATETGHAAKIEAHVISPAERAEVAAAARPAMRAPIEKRYGAEGLDMLGAPMASIDAENPHFDRLRRPSIHVTRDATFAAPPWRAPPPGPPTGQARHAPGSDPSGLSAAAAIFAAHA
jgi:hypothetical protein